MVYSTRKQFLNSVFINENITMDADAKISNDNEGSYGWNDIVSTFDNKNRGVNVPNFDVVFGDYYGFLFSPSSMNEVFVNFHILHDIIANSPLYPHVHFMPTTNNSGVVRWGFEYNIALGHDQEAFSATTSTIYIEHTVAANSIRKHIVAECSDADSIIVGNLEPDTCILARVFRDASHANDTYPDEVHAWQCDIHYQTSNFNSKNKEPNFFE